jgi:hypothetical protein
MLAVYGASKSCASLSYLHFFLLFVPCSHSSPRYVAAFSQGLASEYVQPHSKYFRFERAV